MRRWALTAIGTEPSSNERFFFCMEESEEMIIPFMKLTK
jgi:hypothetical protein